MTRPEPPCSLVRASLTGPPPPIPWGFADRTASYARGALGVLGLNAYLAFFAFAVVASAMLGRMLYLCCRPELSSYAG